MSVWVFGYGSLVWRPDFPAVEARPALVGGFVRRFWQGSTDHRGVPGAPGRVATLVESAGDVVGGRAYRVGAGDVDAVLARLDHREQGGYDRHVVPLRAPGGGVFAEGLVYRATPDNPNWLGPATLDAMVRQIARAAGPSGPNRDYVLELARALAQLGFDDEHVAALADGLRA